VLAEAVRKFLSQINMPTDAVESAPTRADRGAASMPTPTFIVTESAASCADRFDVWSALVLFVAIGLAGIAAYFSVSGMTRIFPGATNAIIVTAAMMQGGKLTGTAWLSRNWRTVNWLLRVILIPSTAILALIDAVGVFGQLSAAHLDPHVEKLVTISTKASESDAKIAAQEQLIADDYRQIAQIDTAIEEAERRGRSTSTLDLARDQRQRRETLVAERLSRRLVLVGLKTERSEVVGEQRKASADIGVLEYSASLFSADRERAIQWLILAMVPTCDPLSLALVVATGTHSAHDARHLRGVA
jgi:hypothetical protein